MRKNGLSAHPKRAWRCVTTQSDPTHSVAENVLDRDFSATDVNEKWVTDVTYVGTDEGWLYFAPMIDLYNREVVGWAMSDTNDTELTLSALQMAINKQKPPKGLIHHSDKNQHESKRKLLGQCSGREFLRNDQEGVNSPMPL